MTILLSIAGYLLISVAAFLFFFWHYSSRYALFLEYETIRDITKMTLKSLIWPITFPMLAGSNIVSWCFSEKSLKDLNLSYNTLEQDS